MRVLFLCRKYNPGGVDDVYPMTSRRQQNRRAWRSKMFLFDNRKRAGTKAERRGKTKKDNGPVVDLAEIELKKGQCRALSGIVFCFGGTGKKQTGDGLQSVDCIVPMGKRTGKEKTDPWKGRLKDR